MCKPRLECLSSREKLRFVLSCECIQKSFFELTLAIFAKIIDPQPAFVSLSLNICAPLCTCDWHRLV
jgi:hypothetical protein